MTGVITESSLRKIKLLDFQQLRLNLLSWKLNKQNLHSFLVPTPQEPTSLLHANEAYVIWWSLEHNKMRSCQASDGRVAHRSCSKVHSQLHPKIQSPALLTETREQKIRPGTASQPGVWRASGDETMAQPRRCWGSPTDRPQSQAVVPLLALHLGRA